MNITVDKAVKLDQLRDYWIGQHRYFKYDEGVLIELPPYLFNDWYKGEDDSIVRKTCVHVKDDGELVWKENVPDAPVPRENFSDYSDNSSSHSDNPAAVTPMFDYVPPAYNRDENSGGPANFDGEMGGDDNPRNPEIEGEIVDQYKKEVAAFREAMKAEMQSLRDQVQALKDKKSEDAPKRGRPPKDKSPDSDKSTAKPKAPDVSGLKEKLNDGNSE